MMMNENVSPRGQAGFTFAELMIALVVVALVIGGYVAANVKAQQSAEAMHERTLAIQDANQVIEQMRDASKTGTFPANVVSAYPDASTPTGFANLPNETITVSYANATADPLDVTITVTWLSYTQREHTEAIQTYITQR
ncbi:MAG: prepilin-type N-terminal cleavage/methylation domain-containing protein [Candidatus Omnitrophota bacterium]